MVLGIPFARHLLIRRIALGMVKHEAELAARTTLGSSSSVIFNTRRWPSVHPAPAVLFFAKTENPVYLLAPYNAKHEGNSVNVRHI